MHHLIEERIKLIDKLKVEFGSTNAEHHKKQKEINWTLKKKTSPLSEYSDSEKNSSKDLSTSASSEAKKKATKEKALKKFPTIKVKDSESKKQFLKAEKKDSPSSDKKKNQPQKLQLVTGEDEDDESKKKSSIMIRRNLKSKQEKEQQQQEQHQQQQLQQQLQSETKNIATTFFEEFLQSDQAKLEQSVNVGFFFSFANFQN